MLAVCWLGLPATSSAVTVTTCGMLSIHVAQNLRQGLSRLRRVDGLAVHCEHRPRRQSAAAGILRTEREHWLVEAGAGAVLGDQRDVRWRAVDLGIDALGSLGVAGSIDRVVVEDVVACAQHGRAGGGVGHGICDVVVGVPQDGGRTVVGLQGDGHVAFVPPRRVGRRTGVGRRGRGRGVVGQPIVTRGRRAVEVAGRVANLAGRQRQGHAAVTRAGAGDGDRVGGAGAGDGGDREAARRTAEREIAGRRCAHRCAR